MGFREWTDKHPKLASTVAGICVIGCIAVVLMQVLGGRRVIRADLPTEFFTVDDGKTYFVASGKNVAPFDYEGKTAVRACVYEADGKKFVAYMDRYTPEARKVVMDGKAVPPWVDARGREVKKPGEAVWISGANSKVIAKICNVSNPSGSGAVPEPVEPQQ